MKRWTTVLASGALIVAALGAPAAGDRATPEQAKAMLDRAVALIEEQGPAAALEAFNDPDGEFRRGELYVFCFGSDNRITAHPKLIGTEVATLKDHAGREVGKEMIALAGKGGGKIEYEWENPVNGQVEPKVSFVAKVGDVACGVGAYKSAGDD